MAPKSCGHVRGKRVVEREEALARIRAAVDAREEGADILIFARTDARQADSLQVRAFRNDLHLLFLLFFLATGKQTFPPIK